MLDLVGVPNFVVVLPFIGVMVWIFVIELRDGEPVGSFFCLLPLMIVPLALTLTCGFLIKYSGFYVWNRVTIYTWEMEGKVTPLLEVMNNSIFSSRRVRAAKALRPLGDKRTVKSFRSALKAESREIRMIAIEALGKFKDNKSVLSLKTIMLKDLNFNIRREAARSLGKIGLESLNEEEKINYLQLDGDIYEKKAFLKNKGIHITINMTRRLKEDLKYNIFELKLIDLSLLAVLSGGKNFFVVLDLDGYKVGAFSENGKKEYYYTDATLFGNISLRKTDDNSVIAQNKFNIPAEPPPMNLQFYKKRGLRNVNLSYKEEMEKKLFDGPSSIVFEKCIKLFEKAFNLNFQNY